MPNRKPAAVKIAEGNAGHRVPASEAYFPTGKIKCPTFLDADARKEWRRVITALADQDILKETDASVLASYCLNYSRWKASELILAREGTTIKLMGSQGQERYVKHPALLVSSEAQNQMMRAGRNLGFSPVDRVRVPASTKQAANPFGNLDSEEDDE